MNLGKILFVVFIFAYFLISCSDNRNESSYPRVTWTVVTSENEFWNELFSSNKNVVIFGGTWCSPCHAAKEWWEHQKAPRGWRFIYWEAQDPENARFGGIVSSFSTRRGKNSLPVASIVRGAARGKRISEIVETSFHGYEENTTNLRGWLSKSP